LTQVLVSGGTGFLGRHLVKALRGRGHAVRVLSRADPSSLDARTELEGLGAEVVAGDLLDGSSVRAAVAGARVVFHLAGRLLEPGVPEQVYQGLHVEGTRHLLDACRGSSGLQAVVHCSTTGVLGPTGRTPAGEDAPPRPSNVYERTKAEGERIALEAAGRHALPLCVARPALVYGPGDRHLAGWFRAIRSGVYRVVGRGDSLLHPVYVSDVVEGLLRCADPGRPRGRVYHLVGPRPMPIGDLAAAIAFAVQRPLPRTHLPRALAYATAAVLERLPGVEPARLPLTRNRVAFMTESRAYSGSRSQVDLGVAPRVELRRGLAQTVEWYRSEGLL
jgi:nucleoside-diphosphate-sugar epimerase